MIQRLYTRFIKPQTDDPDLQSRAIVLNWVLFGTLVLTGVSGLNTLYGILLSHSNYFARLILIIIVWCLLLILYSCSRVRHCYRLTGGVLVSLFFGCASLILFAWGVANPLGSLLFGLTIVMAGILLGARYSLYYALATTMALTVFIYSNDHGLVHPDTTWLYKPATMVDVASFAALFSVIALVSWLFNRQMELSLRRARRSEAALKRQRDLLEEKVEERTRELQAAQLDRIQQFYRFAELGHVSTALFHDLANHLMSVSIDIEGLKKRGRSTMLGRIQSNIQYIDSVVQRVRQQIHGKAQDERFDAAKEMTAIIQLLAYNATKQGVTISFTPKPAKPLLIKADVTRFRQVVTNLIQNAVDAYDGTKRQAKVVTAGLECTKSVVIISVADQGRGIPARLQAKIFEPFYSTKSQGIGIGLFVVKKVVADDFKGSIELRSTPKTGTTFIVKVPLRP